MKNIIGERVLGLPGEPRVDKGVPWKDVLALARSSASPTDDRSRASTTSAPIPRLPARSRWIVRSTSRSRSIPSGCVARHHHAPVDQLLHVELDVADAHRATRPASSSPSPSSTTLARKRRRSQSRIVARGDERDARPRRVVELARSDRPIGTTRRCPRARSRARSRSDRRSRDARPGGARAGRASATASASSRGDPAVGQRDRDRRRRAERRGRVQQPRLPPAGQHESGGVVDDAEARGRLRSPAR